MSKNNLTTHQFDIPKVLGETNLLSAEDFTFLKDHSDKFEKRFRTRSLFRSKFEMEASVLNEDVHPTPDSKYWQAIGEQNVHITELISLSYQSKKMSKDLELKEIELDEATLELQKLEAEQKEVQGVLDSLLGSSASTIGQNKDEAKERSDRYQKAYDRATVLSLLIRRKKIEIDKLTIEFEEQNFNLKQSNKVAQERMREIKQWEDIISNLEPQLEFGTDNFELHHPKRYLERYGRRAMRLDILTPEDKENVISHFLSFAQQPENKEEAKKYLRDMITIGGMPPNHGLVKALQDRIGQPDLIQLSAPEGKNLDQDYPSKDIANQHDPVVKSFFVRKTLKILVVSPHRLPTDKMVMNIWGLQTPAAYDCQLWEPTGYTVSEARTSSIKKAIAEGYHFVQWIDDDMIFPRNALVQLINHQADIVGGFYYRKYTPLESCGMHEYLIKGEMVPRPIQNFNIGDIIHNTLVLPSGCTLLNLDIFNNPKMDEPWYRTVTITGAPAITEDTYFCQKAKMAGYDVITDLGVQCVHVDLSNGRLYGHPSVVDMEKNIFIHPEDYCL